VVSDPKLSKSGVYWSWNEAKGSLETEVSDEVSNDDKAQRMFELSSRLVGLKA
jgi:protochlorophyllide reductase